MEKSDFYVHVALASELGGLEILNHGVKGMRQDCI